MVQKGVTMKTSVEKWPGINPEAFDIARTLEPDVKRLLGVARPKLQAYIDQHTTMLPIMVRYSIRHGWWAVARIVVPVMLQLIIELALVRREFFPAEEASPCVQAALSGDGATEWEKP
jgi:hypothetical protein